MICTLTSLLEGKILYLDDGSRVFLDGFYWNDGSGTNQSWTVIEFFKCPYIHSWEQCLSKWEFQNGTNLKGEKHTIACAKDLARLELIQKHKSIERLEVYYTHDYQTLMRTNKEFYQFMCNFRIGPPMVSQTFTQQAMAQAITNEEIVGFVDCTLRVSPEKYRDFFKFPP